MRDLTLSIAGRLVDLPSSAKGLVRLTQARAALSDLESRNGEYSWPITLPPTRDNARIFGVSALHPVGLNKFASVDFDYELRCESEIFTGTFRLMSLKGGYTGQLLGAGFSWALLLGEKKLNELTFAPIPYDGTQLEAILAKDCDSTDVQFPLVSFGNFFAPPLLQTQPDGSVQEVPNPPGAGLDYPLSVDDYPPGVYLRNVLRQIFKEIGWGLSGRILDESQWRQTVLTCAGADTDKAWPWGALLPASGTGTTTSRRNSQYSYFNAGPGTGYENTAVGFDENASAGNIDGYDLSGELFFLPVPAPVIQSGGTRALDGLNSSFVAPRPGTYDFAWTATASNGHQTIEEHSVITISTAHRAMFARVVLAVVVLRGGAGVSNSTSGLFNGGTVDPLDVPAYQLVQGMFNGAGNIAAPATFTQSCSVFLETGDVAQLCLIARRQLNDITEGQVFVRREFVVNLSATSFACTAYRDNDGVSQTMLQPSAFLPPLTQKEVVSAFLRLTDTVPVPDFERRTVHLLSRVEQTIAAGEPVDISGLVDPDALSYEPSCGAGIGALVFAPPSQQDPLLADGFDTVRVSIGPAPGEQTVTGLFAPVAFRAYRLASGTTVALPTITDQASLDTARSETAWDISSQGARLLRYTGPHATLTIPFAARAVPVATSAWDGVLAWSGEHGAVATYYADTIQRALHGHLGKCTANLTPALYRKLTPGRTVYLYGAEYRLDAVNQYDLASEDNQTAIELLRSL